MATRIYWMMHHNRRAVHELYFRITCWWLSQQVEFLEWRLKMEAAAPPMPSTATAVSASVGQGDRYAVSRV
jgi:hypothetical protein